ncbi:MAG: acyl dehydratase [Deltaproteobacteria bacterium]|nr:acyl dehydratase [Deltaproteobacteria bacterium]MBW2419309.1 acyl dehydratase [Deltaproteobacteria bacterium]
MSAKTITLGDVNVGDKLPELAVDITSSLIVGGAIASNDYTPVHHDKGAAQAAGMQDVFMNILTTNGLVGRFVTDWAGVNAAIKGVSIKLGTPNLPGDTMKFNGSIAEKDEAAGTVVVQLAGKNTWGNHVEGTVTVALPAA